MWRGVTKVAVVPEVGKGAGIRGQGSVISYQLAAVSCQLSVNQKPEHRGSWEKCSVPFGKLRAGSPLRFAAVGMTEWLTRAGNVDC